MSRESNRQLFKGTLYDSLQDVQQAYADWFEIELGPWVTVNTKNRASGFPIARRVRFSVGKCLVDGCGFTKRLQFVTRVEKAMVAHADDHIRKLEAKVGPEFAVTEPLLPETDEPPF